VLLHDADEPVGVRERQRPQHHRVHDGKDRRVRADAQRERQHRRDGESWCPPQHAARILDILARVAQPAKRSRLALILLGLLDAAECAPRGQSRLFRRQPAAPKLVLEDRQV